VDFVTSVGFGAGPGDRARLGLTGAGPRQVITDLGILRPDPDRCELTLTALYPGVSTEDVRAAAGWDLAVAPTLDLVDPPDTGDLTALRALQAASSNDASSHDASSNDESEGAQR
jgi:glutaconate CoA-transferase subunit B